MSALDRFYCIINRIHRWRFHNLALKNESTTNIYILLHECHVHTISIHEAGTFHKQSSEVLRASGKWMMLVAVLTKLHWMFRWMMKKKEESQRYMVPYRSMD